MEKPQPLRAVRLQYGPMMNDGRSTLCFILEDEAGRKFYTWFATRHNYLDGVMKSIGRLRPLDIGGNKPASTVTVAAEELPGHDEVLVKHSTGMKENAP